MRIRGELVAVSCLVLACNQAPPCGVGTTVEDGVCVSILSCGAGTVQQGAQCILDGSPAVTCGFGTHVSAGQCVPDVSGASCGTGTRLEGSTCVSTLSCGAGTQLSNDTCIPDSTLATCGPGTHSSSGTCVSDLTCGPRTHLDGRQCVADPAVPPSCGPGTHPAQGTCVADVTCGSGTVRDGGACVPDPSGDHFEVRIGASIDPADGFSRIPVLAIGSHADGTAIQEPMVLGMTNAMQGRLSPYTVQLGLLGADSWFVPCNGTTNPSCLGPAQLTLSRASAPGVPVATSAIFELVVPTGVGSPAACLLGGNVLFFDGESGDWVHPGLGMVRLGSWTAGASPAGAANYISVHVVPGDSAQGLWWDTVFSAEQLGTPFAVQTYEGAERWPFQSPGHPGMDISGDGRGCNMLSGRFQILELTQAGSTLQGLTVTFEQSCDGLPILHGCVHFEQQ